MARDCQKIATKKEKNCYDCSTNCKDTATRIKHEQGQRRCACSRIVKVDPYVFFQGGWGHSRKKVGTWEPGNLVPSRFLGQIRKVEARLGKLAKIRKVETN